MSPALAGGFFTTSATWEAPTTRMSRNYTYIPSFLSLPPYPCSPLGHHRAPDWAPNVLQQLLTSYYFTHDAVRISMLLCPLVPPSPSSTVAGSLLSAALGLLAMRGLSLVEMSQGYSFVAVRAIMVASHVAELGLQ